MNVETAAAGSASTLNSQKDKLIDDIKSVVADAQDMLKQAKSSSMEGYSAVRAELEDRLADSIIRLQEVQEELKARARNAAKATDTYVHDNPWKSMGYVALAGLVVGFLITRSR
jgi:ElaB/YqjD/DUF883 family membrane-anchored ribosome-binding protein